MFITCQQQNVAHSLLVTTFQISLHGAGKLWLLLIATRCCSLLSATNDDSGSQVVSFANAHAGSAHRRRLVEINAA